MEWHTFLVVVHIIGTALGVGGATFAEIFLLKAVRDGEIDPIESSFMQVTYRIVRVGLALLVLSGFGFLILYRFTDLEARLYSPLLWSKLTIVVVILINAILLQTRRIPLWLGSALSFASWYAAMLIIPLRPAIMPITYLEIMGWYIAFVAIVALALGIIRKSLGIKF
ncbi:MAG: hypothetical protein NUV49_00215 [Patescibacteria group bacterium]|nr:hypothetical protein [Patescibacteria group bacterium]